MKFGVEFSGKPKKVQWYHKGVEIFPDAKYMVREARIYQYQLQFKVAEEIVCCIDYKVRLQLHDGLSHDFHMIDLYPLPTGIFMIRITSFTSTCVIRTDLRSAVFITSCPQR